MAYSLKITHNIPSTTIIFVPTKTDMGLAQNFSLRNLFIRGPSY